MANKNIDVSKIKCPRCGEYMRPVWFTQKEYRTNSLGCQAPTGRERRAVSHLECDRCGHNEIVDDSFDEPYLERRKG